MVAGPSGFPRGKQTPRQASRLQGYLLIISVLHLVFGAEWPCGWLREESLKLPSLFVCVLHDVEWIGKERGPGEGRALYLEGLGLISR